MLFNIMKNECSKFLLLIACIFMLGSMLCTFNDLDQWANWLMLPAALMLLIFAYTDYKKIRSSKRVPSIIYFGGLFLLVGTFLAIFFGATFVSLSFGSVAGILLLAETISATSKK